MFSRNFSSILGTSRVCVACLACYHVESILSSELRTNPNILFQREPDFIAAIVLKIDSTVAF